MFILSIIYEMKLTQTFSLKYFIYCGLLAGKDGFSSNLYLAIRFEVSVVVQQNYFFFLLFCSSQCFCTGINGNVSYLMIPFDLILTIPQFKFHNHQHSLNFSNTFIHLFSPLKTFCSKLCKSKHYM